MDKLPLSPTIDGRSAWSKCIFSIECIGDKHSSTNDTEIFEKIFEDQRKILLEIFLACLLNRVAERIVKKDTNWKFIIF